MRQIKRFTISAFVLLAVSQLAIHAPAQNAKIRPEYGTQIKNSISTFMTANKVPGLSVAIVTEHGEFVWSEGFGMADLENSVAATPKTLYRLGAGSKGGTDRGAGDLGEK